MLNYPAAPHPHAPFISTLNTRLLHFQTSCMSPINFRGNVYNFRIFCWEFICIFFYLGFFFFLVMQNIFLGIRYFNQPLNWKAKNDNFFYITGMKVRCIQKEK
jgi:hypothetical protein